MSVQTLPYFHETKIQFPSAPIAVYTLVHSLLRAHKKYVPGAAL